MGNGLEGFQVVVAIRERERATGGRLPVIALTARSRKEDRKSCHAVGMDDYLTKPVRSAELFAAIDRAVSARWDSRPGRAVTADGPGLLDPTTLLDGCGDGELLRAMCEGLRAFAPARLAGAADALKARGAPRLREEAHKLCGLLSMFSTAAGGVASDLEDKAASGRLDEACPLVERLGAMTRQLIREVNGLSIDDLRRRAGLADGPGQKSLS